jgi:peptide/nickel transport system permease protein
MRPEDGMAMPLHSDATGLKQEPGAVTQPRRMNRIVARFRNHRAAQVGILLLAAMLIMGLFAPVVAPVHPDAVNMANRLAPPSLGSWFGTDQLGRDLLSRVIFGARVSLSIGVISVGVALLGGLPLGMIAGYFGGAVDRVISAVLDFLLSFPPLLLAILVIALFGPGLTNAMLAIGVSLVPIFARLMRAEVMRVREEVYIEAVTALGASHLKIIARHVLPNTLAPIIVQTTLSLATAILSASYLGFLGLGAQPPTSEWGAMLNDGRRYIRTAPHVAYFPGLAIMITVLAFNLFGDGLRDALDPKASRR